MESIEKAVEIAEERNGRREARNPEIRKAIEVVYKFIQHDDVILYGGTAINNLLPVGDQFYHPKSSIPDYDMFSETPQLHAMIIADLLKEADIHEIEVRPGVHMGTFKVFANYTAVADVTFLDSEIFDRMWDDAIEKDGVMYSNPNFLRMSMYLELSRPRGDVSRWTKVFKRLALLNKAYPIKCPRSDSEEDILEDPTDIESFLADNDAVILGLHASQIHDRKIRAWDLPVDLLVTSKDMDDTVENLKGILVGTKSEVHPAIGEFVSRHVDITKKDRLIVRVFETQACHSYHIMQDGTKVASIPTILQFFMSFLYADKKMNKELDLNRLLCVAQRLVDLAQGEKHSRRFRFLTPLDCIGDQETLTDVRTEKAKLYNKLSENRGSPEFLRSFFSYNPAQLTKTQKQHIRSALKTTYRNRRASRI
jgi:hypothetical protein